MSLRDDWLQSYDGAQAYGEEVRRTCSTMAFNQALMERHPAFRRLLGDLEHETHRRLEEPTAFAEEDPVAIPVVVHVIYRSAAENVSDAQVRSQIAVLNQDFGATNADRMNIPAVWAGLSQDSRIRFQLASRDPSGAATNGIVRVPTNVAEFGADDRMKDAATGGSDPWPADQYLNIWICNLGGGVLGYAQFPGGPPATDGVVIGYKWFGTNGAATAPFNLGRTTTHEVGHWLNLRHIWGDTEDCTGSDMVQDTPLQQLPNYQSPQYPSISCGNAPDGDMFMNYMDYVDDVAMFMFTNGQVARMRATIQSIRSGLLTSNGLQ